MRTQLLWEWKKWKNSAVTFGLAGLLLAVTVLWLPLGILFPDQTDHIPYTAYRTMTNVIRSNPQTVTSERVQKTFDAMLLEQTFPKNRMAATAQQELFLYRETADELKETEGVYAHWAAIGRNAVSVLESGTTDPYMLRYAASLQSRADALTETYGAEDIAFSGGYGLKKVWDYGSGVLLLLAALVLMASGLISSEKEQGMLRLSCDGHYRPGRMMAAKYLAGGISLFLALLFVYLTRLLAVSLTYGLPDFALPVQCVPGYGNSLLPVRIGAAIPLYFLFQFLAFLLVYTLFFEIHLLCNSTILSVLVDAGILILEFLLSRIDSHSFLSVFGSWNVYALLSAGDLVGRYETISLFGYPADRVFCLLLFLVISFALLLPAVRLGMRTRKPRNPFRRLYAAVERAVRFLTGGRTLTGYEIRKGWFYGGGWILPVCFAAGLMLLYQPQTDALYMEEEIWYRHYVLSVAGPYSAEKAYALQEEREGLLQLQEKLRDNPTEEQAIYYSQRLKAMTGLEQAIAYGEYLRGRPGSSFVYERSYETLWGIHGRGQAVYGLRALRVILFTALVLVLWNVDISAGMLPLLESAWVGEKQILRRRVWQTVTAAVLLTTVSHLVWMRSVAAGFALDFSAAANSLTLLARLPAVCTTGLVTLLQWGLHCGMMCALGIGGGYALRRFKSVAAVMVGMLAAGVLLILW